MEDDDLLDLFAMIAMIGVQQDLTMYEARNIARRSYEIAKAMMAEREAGRERRIAEVT